MSYFANITHIWEKLNSIKIERVYKHCWLVYDLNLMVFGCTVCEVHRRPQSAKGVFVFTYFPKRTNYGAQGSVNNFFFLHSHNMYHKLFKNC